MSTQINLPAHELTKAPLPKFVGYFLWLGTVGFGGPIALAGHMQQDLVDKRGWISKEEAKGKRLVIYNLPEDMPGRVAIDLLPGPSEVLVLADDSANPRFVFTAKLWQKFMHDPSATVEDERAVRAGFDVLHKAGKLGAVLLQFPFAFHRDAQTTAYLETVLKRFRDYPLAVEVRHATWNDPEIFAILREHNAAFCNIDQPVIGRSLEPSQEITSATGYVRMHGRRYDTWFSDDPEVPQHERYNYLYSAEELSPWADRIRAVGEKTRQTFVITNNHYLGKAVVNALELISMLKATKVQVPDPLRLRYPELESIASNPPESPTLFPLGNRM